MFFAAFYQKFKTEQILKFESENNFMNSKLNSNPNIFSPKKLISFLARKKITLFRIQNWFKNKVIKTF